jgi:2-(1,2-epoxy-1,2-dihydrophenyl)acetyl-CoA isomerase
MSYQHILTETRRRVRIISMNRPDRLNAWTRAMGREKAEAIRDANADPAIGAIILTGAGRGFCAGADIRDTLESESRERDVTGPVDRTEDTDWILLVRRSKPMVAAVNGAAIGMGCTMLLCCDTIVASEEAKFAMPFVRLGVVPELGSTQLLAARVGFGRASELCLSGRTFSAAEARAYNMVEELVPPERLMARALEIADSFAPHSALALKHTKELLTKNFAEPDMEIVHIRETAAFEECADSDEHKAAIAAFLSRARN